MDNLGLLIFLTSLFAAICGSFIGCLLGGLFYAKTTKNVVEELKKV